jgi:hypothetical protein
LPAADLRRQTSSQKDECEPRPTPISHGCILSTDRQNGRSGLMINDFRHLR